MTTYKFTFEITPNVQYCGKCEGWGRTSARPDQCIVFDQRLSFYAADPGCMEKGYQRCQACLDWERDHLAATDLTVEALP